MAWGPIIVALIKAMMDWISDRAQDTTTEAVVDKSLKSRLQAVIRKAKRGTIVVLLLLPLSGCFTRTIYVRDGTPVRLAAPIKDHPVWVPTEDGLKKSKMDIPEGWWVLSDPGEED